MQEVEWRFDVLGMRVTSAELEVVIKTTTAKQQQQQQQKQQHQKQQHQP